MSANYIPTSFSGFDGWLTNFSALLTAAPTDYGLVSGNAVTVAAQQVAYHAAYIAANDPSTRTSPTVAAQLAARQLAELIVRPFAVLISQNPAVSDELKSDIGVTVRAVVRTPVPAPTTSPALALVSAMPGVLNVDYRDSTTPMSKAKPAGVIGMQVYLAVGTVPAVDPAQTTYRNVVTKSPTQIDTTGNAGKVYTIFSRWVTRGGVGGQAYTGPWSAPLVTNAV